MSLPINIRGSNDGGHEAQVTVDGALLVATYPAEIRDLGDQKNARRFYGDTFKSVAGSSSLAINGALTPTTFVLGSDSFSSGGLLKLKRAKAITRLRFVLEGTNMDPGAPGELRQFGPILAPGLTNGLNVTFTQGPFSTLLSPTPIRTLWDLIKNANAVQSFPGALATNVDGFTADVDLPNPFIIDFGSVDQLSITVQDDLSAFSNIQLLCQGWYELETD